MPAVGWARTVDRFLVLLCVLGVLALFLAAMGHSWARDLSIRARAGRRGWRLAPPTSEIQAEMDDGSYNPSKLRVEIEAVGLVKARRFMLIVGPASLLVGGAGLLFS